MTQVDFYWDVASPYTYLAFTQIEAVCERAKAELHMVPFLLGGVFKTTGNAAPANVMAKAKYMHTDLDRWRKEYQVPMKLPVSEVTFPINSLKPMRVAAAIQAQHPEVLDRYTREIMTAYWERGTDISTEENLRGALKSLELDAEALLAAIQTQEVKDLLRKNTEVAVEKGAFGAPAMFVNDALFWGNDRLHHLEHALAAAE